MIASCVQAQEIHLKTRTITTTAAQSSGSSTAVKQRFNSRQTIHQIVEFDHPPGVDDLAALLLSGAPVTAALPDNAVVVSVRGGLSNPPAGVAWVGQLEAQDKVSPLLSTKSNGPVPVIVEFHSDVDAAQQATAETLLGLTFLRPAGLMPQHVIVQATSANLTALSNQDSVAYIFPADPGLLAGADTYPCAGMLTTAGTIPQYANVTHGWDLDSDNIAHLTYFFGSLTAKVPAATVQSEIERALSEWSKNVNVTFTPTTVANISRSVFIEFASGAHGDTYPFNGPGGILAHTFYPVPINAETIAGDMHFNADESWNVGSDIDVYTVALHEAGHALGLSHSDNPGDVMYPYYQRGVPLSANDIGAAQQLYAPPAPAAPPPMSGTTQEPDVIPLVLTLDAVPATTEATQINVTGIVAGGTGTVSIQWQTNHGYSGTDVVSPGSDMWTACDITLVAGANVITLTAFDAADHVSTQSETITLQPTPAASALPIAMAITSPATELITTSASVLSITGTASGGAGITQVTWQTSNGATGVASGVNPWFATGVPLLQGTTTIVLRAFDSRGANAWVALVAVHP